MGGLNEYFRRIFKKNQTKFLKLILLYIMNLKNISKSDDGFTHNPKGWNR